MLYDFISVQILILAFFVSIFAYLALILVKKYRFSCLFASIPLIVQICSRYSMNYEFVNKSLRLYRMKGDVLILEQFYKSLRMLERDFGYEVSWYRTFQKIKREVS